jgi:hypothetical protein
MLEDPFDTYRRHTLSTQKLPLSEVQLQLKQIRVDYLSDFQRKALQSVLGSYIAGPSDHLRSRRTEEMRKWLDADIEYDRSTSRRYSGDDSLQRGRYFSIASDIQGYDGGTLLHELYAYGAFHNYPGLVEMFDLSMPQTGRVLEVLSSLQPQNYNDLDLSTPSLLLVFLPLAKDPPFEATYGQGVRFAVQIPLSIYELVLDHVVDLRRLETADWFTHEFIRFGFDVSGRQIPAFLNRPRVDSFQDLLPTLLNQWIGGGWTICRTIGVVFRKLGVNGFVYPSARFDSFVEIRDGEVIDSGGWNYVDYRGSGPPPTQAVVDIDTGAWPSKIGYYPDQYSKFPEPIILPSVSIDYCDEGDRRGSWTVTGLADHQRAWFALAQAISMMAADDAKLAREMIQPELTYLLRGREATLVQEIATTVQRALLGNASARHLLADWEVRAENDRTANVIRKIRGLIRHRS